ncbi:transcriptional regulator, TetR family [Paenibacillus algorifonticola]|uniref:Transcriptional regulator, TetR family n=1 Tax=Paenibacillus algorifonticola TaxID=684063 RepID=A0A1I2HBB2_9BACL|nr:DUF2269 family protein [Paenibacillus algorifonticola]SFF26036.1 transcriptional regulator, TetR family [Paenibacillus algorifonticola]
MRKLAEMLGYSPATLYLYYHDKDHLLFSVVDDAFTRFRTELAQAASSTSDPTERLDRIGEAYVQFGLTHSIYYQLMFMWRVDYLIQAKPGEETPRMEAFQVLFDSVEYAQSNNTVKPGYSVFAWNWLGISYGLFILSGVIWMIVLLPLQNKMIRQGQLSYEQNTMTNKIILASRNWNFYGILATLTPIASMILMVWKPCM